MLFALLMVMIAGRAQDDLQIVEEEQIEFTPGLYLSFDDFISNNPIDFEHVEGDLEGFFENPMNSKELTIKKNETVLHVEQSTVWGYTDGKNVFLNRSLFKGMNLDMINLKIKVEPWVKIHTIGKLSFILFLTTILTQSQSQLGGNSHANSYESNYILNTKDGKFYKGNLSELKFLIADDAELLDEFVKTHGNDEIKFFTFLKKYNKRHPFQFR
jgi:hypothetical protein